MKPMRPSASRPAAVPAHAFTLIELLVVISIIAVLAGFVVGLAPMANRRMKEARIRTELAALSGAIEAYKARFGVYPPDNYNPVLKQSNPVQHSLFYELTGVLVDNQNRTILPADDAISLNPDVFLNYFGREGVLNSVPRIPGTASDQVKLDREQKKRLMRREFKPGQYAEIFRAKSSPGYVDLEVLAVGFSGDASGKKGNGIPWPPAVAPNQHPIPSNPGLNPWRYVSTNPTNNPGRYDLWAELPTGRNSSPLIIGNW
ncbi:MAG: type II secretion system protein [Verrucomicrobiae bacterium]|nr:type II secretion system protein [Verrucomicrobiae bacterium]